MRTRRVDPAWFERPRPGNRGPRAPMGPLSRLESWSWVAIPRCCGSDQGISGTYRRMIQDLLGATAYNLVAILVAGGLLVRWGLDLTTPWCRRDEPPDHHRGCEFTWPGR